MRENWNKNEILTIIGLLATVVATLIFPFVQNPLLDYDVTLENKNNVTLENKNNETIVPFQIDIRNWGLKTANNVIISLNMPGSSFRQIKSIPYLSDYLNTTSDNGGNQLVKIGAIPSSSQTTIIGNVVFPSSNGENLIVYLRSDETVGQGMSF